MIHFSSARCLGWAFLLCLSLAFVPPVVRASGPSIALTFDDGPDMSDAVRMTPAQRNAAILRQLADAHLKSILFVTRMTGDEARTALVRQWGILGHLVGNHTLTHPSFNEIPLADFEQELLAADRAIRALPGYTPRFRFPFLNEGNTREKRDGFRAFLDANGYLTGPVSVDASDWYYSERLSERLQKDPHADLAPYKAAYLRHLMDRAQYYDGLSRQLLGRSVSHVLLIHHNLINALFLSDVIRMFKQAGWTLLDAEVAFKDPVYAMRPDIVPAGGSILWGLAKQRGLSGLRDPGEDGVYEKPILDLLRL